MFRWKSVTQTHFRIWLAETSQTTWWKHMPRLLARGNGHLYVVIIIWSTLLQLQMVSIIIVLLFIAWRTRSGSMSSGTLPDIQYSCFINIVNWVHSAALLCCAVSITHGNMTGLSTDTVDSHWVPEVLSFCPTKMKSMLQSHIWGNASIWNG